MSLPADNAETASIGHPYTGKLRDGVRLPPNGPYHVAQRSTRARNWLFGTGYLVRGIMRAAESVHILSGSGEPLMVGNLSRRQGGNIKLSLSHNSGRDVDFAYYSADLQGRSVASEYHRFGDNGLSLDAPTKFKLDLPRNWQLLKSLIRSNEVEVQWIIVAPGIETLLLNYAKKSGEPGELIQKAERMMMLPGYAKPHDNHIHLRVHCSPQDWHNGCHVGGPIWPWNRRLLKTLSKAATALQPRLNNSSAHVRRRTLQFIRKKQLVTALTPVAQLLSDPDKGVRREALLTLDELTNEATARAVLDIARQCKATVAARLISKALPLAGAGGVATAQELLNGIHPALRSPRVVRAHRLIRSAKKLLRKYN
jgi:penicillin-insensitive murein endopeptidase